LPLPIIIIIEIQPLTWDLLPSSNNRLLREVLRFLETFLAGISSLFFAIETSQLRSWVPGTNWAKWGWKVPPLDRSLRAACVDHIKPAGKLPLAEL